MKKQDSLNEKNHLSTEYVSKDPRYTIDNIMEDLDSFGDPLLDWKGVDDFDRGIIDWTDTAFFEQSEFQNRWFVVNSQVTPYRQIRQACMEVQSRYQSLQRVIIQYKRSINDCKRVEAEMAEEKDEYWKEDKKYELELLYLDLQSWKNKIRQCQSELSGILKIVKEKVGDLPASEVTKYLSDKDTQNDEEHKYWIARMAKQSATDLLTTGRIQAGNLDSMLMMNPEDQAAVTDLAMTYSTAMNKSVGKIKEAAEAKVERMMPEDKPPQLFDTAGVLSDYATNNLADRKQRDLQSSDQPETTSRVDRRITDSISKGT